MLEKVVRWVIGSFAICNSIPLWLFFQKDFDAMCNNYWGTILVFGERW